MKVLIKSEKKTFFMIMPTALLLNRLAAAIAVKVIKSKYPEIEVSIPDIKKLFHSIKVYKKKRRHWEVINISSANGEQVWISL